MLAALTALLASAVQAGANEYTEPEHVVVTAGLLIQANDAEARKVLATIRCTGTEYDGKQVGLAVAPEVDMASLPVGAEVGAQIDKSTDPKTVVAVLDEDCPTPAPDPKPEPEHPKPDDHSACDDRLVARSANGDGDGERYEDGCLPQFVRRFISRVWKFVGEVDYYEDGELSMTLGKILNLPRRWRSQDDELLDQDTTVLVSNRVRVFREGERVGREALDDANDVRVHGKLLRPRQWHVDDDGSPVATIRAKKVYITG